MTRVLVPTYPKDIHAVEVALALAAQGHEALLWHGSDFPTLQSASIEIRDGALDWEIRGAGLEAARPPFDAVWLRRPTSSVFPQDIHPADLPVARREARDFLSGLVHLAAPDAFWVNPLASRPRSELKAVQLQEAVRSGLAIPPTLMSNDPERIRRFLGELPGGAIYKPFNPVQWETDERVAVLWTSQITAGDLPQDEILRLTPGIFQAKVDKAHELRVTVMGHHVVTARLLSQELADAQLDWRAGGSKLRVEPDRLPAAVENACLALLRRLGLVFGCLDFIVTPRGGSRLSGGQLRRPIPVGGGGEPGAADARSLRRLPPGETGGLPLAALCLRHPPRRLPPGRPRRHCRLGPPPCRCRGGLRRA
jgi:hypothetical protein